MQKASEQVREYLEGQVWRYRTRPGESASLIKVQAIEPFPGLGDNEQVFHISIVGVEFKKPGLKPFITHAPVSKESLDASVTHLAASEIDFPSASHGMSVWRENKGGVFTVALAEVVRIIDEAVSSE